MGLRRVWERSQAGPTGVGMGFGRGFIRVGRGLGRRPTRTTNEIGQSLTRVTRRFKRMANELGKGLLIRVGMGFG